MSKRDAPRLVVCMLAGVRTRHTSTQAGRQVGRNKPCQRVLVAGRNFGIKIGLPATKGKLSAEEAAGMTMTMLQKASAILCHVG